MRKEGGKTFANVKSADGQVLFDGEITTDDQRKALADSVRARLAQAEQPGIRIPGMAPAAGTEAAPSPGAPEGKAGEAPAKPRRRVDPREGA